VITRRSCSHLTRRARRARLRSRSVWPKRAKPLLVIVVSVVVLAVGVYAYTRVALRPTDQTHTLVVLGALQVVATIGVVGGLVWLVVTFVRAPPTT
jgi:hypothetical protein